MKAFSVHSPRILLVLELLLYVLLTAFALHATWLTWPDAFIDFSRELYIPWRISCGDVLYRDLAYDFGPLSVYLNATLFSLLGHPSIHTLFALNFAFWLATLLTLRALLRRMARPAVATLAVSLCILLFSFNRYLGVGNYNFLAPYSHELPRGFLFSLLSLLTLDSALETALSPKRRSAAGRVGAPSKCTILLLFLAGLLLGLALFTKPEIAIATVSASAVLFLSRRFRVRGHPARDGATETPPSSLQAPSDSHPSPRRVPLPREFPAGGLPMPSISPLFAPFLVGIFVAVVAVLLPLSIALGSFSHAICNGLLNLYRACFNPVLADLAFYREIMGFDDVPSHILRLLLGAILVSSPFILARLALSRYSSRLLRIAGAALLVFASATIGFCAFFPLNGALPLAPVLFAALSLRNPVFPSATERMDVLTLPASSRLEPPGPPPAFLLATTAHSPPDTRHLALSLAFATFAFLLIAKMLLDAHIWHYGFVLALPAFCCAVLLLFRPLCPHSQAVMAVAILLCFSTAAFRMQSSIVRHLDISQPVHDGAYRTARFNADAFNAALEWIRDNTAPGSSLAVLPEGAILNVFSRHPNPTPYAYLSAGDCVRFGQTAILSAYSNSPPDTLVLVTKLGEPRFGIDYAQDLMDFLNLRYTPVFGIPLSTPAGTIPYLVIARKTDSLFPSDHQESPPP